MFAPNCFRLARAWCTGVLLLGATPSAAANRYLRPSQLGYGTSDIKVARVLSKTNLNGQAFRVLRVPAGTIALSGTAPTSLGAWGSFNFTHRLDFSALTETGQFRLNLPATGENSLPFTIGNGTWVAPGYKTLAQKLLGFFRVQRCGPTRPSDHGVCHRLDAHHIVGGPNAGQPVNVQGGWHDAGDYIKFMTTVAYSTHLLLWADELRPNLASDLNSNGVSDLLDEAKIGARFLLKLRYQPGRFLWQVSDEADHGEAWRLPENDALAANRPAYYGPGKNHLGRYVAALARAARAFGTVAPGLADSCRIAALDAYAGIASAPNLVNGAFYVDSGYKDKVALGAIELYLTTNQMSYLNDAKTNVDQIGPGYWAAWDMLNGLAATLVAPFHAPALANLLEDVSAFQDQANVHPFGMTGTETWGINHALPQMAAEALLYGRLTGLSTYNGVAYAQRDFLLGTNPWGICFVGDVGAVSPQDFHHQVATIVRGGAMPGALAEGPAPASDIQDQGIVLDDPDEYAEFQASRGTYHDDRANYVTNEPTLHGQAAMIFLVALFADRGEPTSIEETNPLRRTTTITAYPNPFRERTRLVLRATSPLPVSTAIEILDVAGHVCRRLQLRGDAAMEREVTWDGLDARGRPAPNGIYFFSTNGITRGRLVRLR